MIKQLLKISREKSDTKLNQFVRVFWVSRDNHDKHNVIELPAEVSKHACDAFQCLMRYVGAYPLILNR